MGVRSPWQVRLEGIVPRLHRPLLSPYAIVAIVPSSLPSPGEPAARRHSRHVTGPAVLPHSSLCPYSHLGPFADPRKEPLFTGMLSDSFRVQVDRWRGTATFLIRFPPSPPITIVSETPCLLRLDAPAFPYPQSSFTSRARDYTLRFVWETARLSVSRSPLLYIKTEHIAAKGLAFVGGGGVM